MYGLLFPARYVDVVVEMTQLRLNERQSHDLFTPYTLNLDFLGLQAV